jgi:hypothetical protein
VPEVALFLVESVLMTKSVTPLTAVLTCLVALCVSVGAWVAVAHVSAAEVGVATEAEVGSGLLIDPSGNVTVGGITSAAIFVTPPSLTGVVTSAAAAPIPGVTVNVYDSAGAMVRSATTDGAGEFGAASLTPGIYYVLTGGGTSYIDKLFNDLPCPYGSCTPTAGTPVVVSAGANTPNVNFSLSPGGVIAGTITASGGATPLSGINVLVYDGSGSIAARGTTNASGVYGTTPGLPTGTYYARTSNTVGRADQLYFGIPCAGGSCAIAGGTPVSVTAGVTTPGIDFSLAPVSGQIAGTIADSATALPIGGVAVTIYDASGAAIGTATTAADGTYKTTTGLQAGSYYLRTTTSPGYLYQIYGGTTCGLSCPSVTTGTPVTLAANDSSASGINFALVKGGRIAGAVTAASSGAPIANCYVYLYSNGGAFLTSMATDATGVYESSGIALPSGDYYVRVSAPYGYVSQLYSGLNSWTSVTSGTPVPVTAGATTPNISFSLQTTPVITGTVKDAISSGPISGVSVSVYNSVGSYVTSASTNSAGVYTATVSAVGTYYLRTGSTLQYLAGVYRGITCGMTCPAVTTGTAVGAIAGATTPGIDFDLVKGGTVSGTVTIAGTGIALPNVLVRLYDNSANSISTYTGTSGTYTMSAVPAGTYYAVTQTSANFVNQLYNGILCMSCTAQSGTPITIVQGAATQNIDFALAPGASIGGRVTAAATGAALPGSSWPASIQAYTSSGALAKSVSASGTGSYTMSGLASGTYYVRTSNVQGFEDQLFSAIACPGGGCTVTSGTGVVATAGTTAVNIDFALAKSAVSFTDEPLVAGITVVRMSHLTELRQRINELRARFSLSQIVWTDSTMTAGVSAVKAVHLTELRSALALVYSTAGRTPPTYAHTTLTPGSTVIAAVDIAELRAAVLAIW